MIEVNVNEKLAEIRKRFAPGDVVEKTTENFEAALEALGFLLAVIDSDVFEFFCTGCRRAFSSIDTLANHQGCKFTMQTLETNGGDNVRTAN